MANGREGQAHFIRINEGTSFFTLFVHHNLFQSSQMRCLCRLKSDSVHEIRYVQKIP